jgi:peptide/nickel transport system permease protein
MKMKNNILLFLAFTVIILFVIGVSFAPNNPNHVDLALRYLPACKEYPLGTDQLGRCILSRLLYGGRTTVGMVLISFFIIILVGTPIGLLFGKNGARHIFLESLLNAVTSIPPIAYLLIFVGAWGNGMMTMLVALTISLLLRLIKLVKTRAALEMKKAYVMCAVTSGASQFNLLFREILPNVIEDEIHYLCLSSADMILTITGFSFIGIGLGDNVIDWGMMVSDAREVVLSHPNFMLYPIAAIVICAFAFNFIAREIERRQRT